MLNKNIFTEANTLDDRERHLTLEMPSQEWLKPIGREREKTLAKQHQGKA
jgi:hypothetical protein